MAAEPIKQIGALALAARAEAGRMVRATDRQPDGGHVRMTVGEFRRLALLLDTLGRAGMACGGVDCLGAAVGGVRTWMTRDSALAACSRAVAEAKRPEPLVL